MINEVYAVALKMAEEAAYKMVMSAQNREFDNDDPDDLREWFKAEWKDLREDILKDYEESFLEAVENQGDEEEITDENTCCFCGAPLDDMGCNPDPADTRPGKRCCGECNEKIVIPARMYIRELIGEVTNE